MTKEYKKSAVTARHLLGATAVFYSKIGIFDYNYLQKPGF